MLEVRQFGTKVGQAAIKLIRKKTLSVKNRQKANKNIFFQLKAFFRFGCLLLRFYGIPRSTILLFENAPVSQTSKSSKKKEVQEKDDNLIKRGDEVRENVLTFWHPSANTERTGLKTQTNPARKSPIMLTPRVRIRLPKTSTKNS
ncbi:unnamed protein product [Acanthoscelides obtectus]|uniref:Uncharacterized protein n=1 Tax=Acanthoscelides obtectus TaxID=200917 RepID=A0A9P0KX31_ACAOB|nr:unnamed protein product [Acanthoscelides obtectus]CAK1676110.1 hypothetical protein AOBTE_LOCUS30592 [Acanthoscelides obtectus]